MSKPHPLNYVTPRSRGRRRIELGICLGVSFFIGHALVELAIWAVVFYGLGHYHATTDNLFELERFTFSYAAEVFLAFVGGLIVAGTFSIVRFQAGYRPIALSALAFGLGGIVTGGPWVVDLILPLAQNNLVALLLILATTIVSAFLLIEAATYQINHA